MELSEADSGHSTKLKFSEVFDELFPSFLAMGMTATDYWEGDNALPVFYRKAHKIKMQLESDTQNYYAWLQGMYIAEAVATCLSKGHTYPKEPYKATEKIPETEEGKQEMTRNAAEGFAAFIALKNKEFRDKQNANESQNPFFGNPFVNDNLVINNPLVVESKPESDKPVIVGNNEHIVDNLQ